MISSHYSFFSSWKREFYIFLHICGGLANDTQSMCRRSWSGDIYVALINVSRNKTKHNLITFKADPKILCKSNAQWKTNTNQITIG